MLIDYFDNWKSVTASIEEQSASQNAAGQTTISWDDVVDDETYTVNWWTDTSNETSTNDRFVDQKKGKALIKYDDLSFTPTTDMRFKVESDYYYIIGVDNVAELNDFYVISWRYDNGA
jgi:hypothetical protein